MDQLTEWFCVSYIISSITLILDRWCPKTTGSAYSGFPRISTTMLPQSGAIIKPVLMKYTVVLIHTGSDSKCKFEFKPSIILYSILYFVQHVANSQKSCASRPDGTVTGTGTRQNEQRVRQWFDSKGINRGPGVKKRGTDAGIKKKKGHWDPLDDWFLSPFLPSVIFSLSFYSACNPAS